MPGAPRGQKKRVGAPTRVSSSRNHSDQVSLFCSYARQDADIVQAFMRAFQGLNDTVNHNVVPFSDQAIGAGREFDAEIRSRLRESDYLLVFYTGARKLSHSYTGWELGYFTGIDDQQGNTPGKQIVSFFLKRPPDPTSQIQGIDLSIDADDLSLSREDYVRATATRAAAAKHDPLTQFFIEVAELAERRRPFPEQESASNKVTRYRNVQEKIVPALRVELFDCFSSRIARSSVEQRCIRFELPKPAASRATLRSIPDETRLTEEGRGFELLGVSVVDPEEGIRWREFKQQFEAKGASAAPALYAIERVLVTVVSAATCDNDQIIRASDNNLYRVIVTEQMEYYDGRLIVNMWFIRFLNRDLYGSKETSMLLSFISVASKYRFLFLEQESPLSIDKFRAETNPRALQEKVRALLRETILIEEESRVFGLDTAGALIVIAGSDADLGKVGIDMKAYGETRIAMDLAASAIVNHPSDAPDYQQARDQWVAALDSFLQASGKINSTYTAKALASLGKHFSHG